ncbi:MAG TPA: hypothetical protein PKV33_05440 [Methanothrix sp.]|nr:hypothetical protein [Methanothrix sp.]
MDRKLCYQILLQTALCPPAGARVSVRALAWGKAARSGPPGGPAVGRWQVGTGLCCPEIREARRRSQLELRRWESCPDASRIVRLAAFRNFRDEFRFHEAHSSANQLDLLFEGLTPGERLRIEEILRRNE